MKFSLFEVALRLCIKYACERTPNDLLKVKCASVASTYFPDVLNASGTLYYFAFRFRETISCLDIVFDCVCEQLQSNKLFDLSSSN